MYRITLTLLNPMTGDTETLNYQFDPTTLTATKWANAFPAVQAKLNTLVTRSTSTEPPTW